jgi:uncharacterized membrane protein YheB (UPF0754 family)
MNLLLDWVLPVVVGGAIGYVTNDIAIKMMFRPLKEKRILGLRVPFTPGILPKNRGRLASSIGDTVSQELITAEVLSGRIEDPQFKESVASLVKGFTSSFLERKLGSFAPGGNGGESPVVPFISDLLEVLVRSESFGATLRAAASAAIESVFDLRLGELVSPDEAARVAERMLELLGSGGTRADIERRLAEALDGLERSGRRISELLPPGMGELVAEAARTLYPKALGFAVDYMRSPAARRTLETRGSILVSDIIRRLSVLQRLIVAAAQYDRNIIANMPAIVDDLIGAVEDEGRKPGAMESLAAELGKAAESLLSKTLAELEEELPGFKEKALALAGRLLALLGEENLKERAAKLVRLAFESLSDKSVREIARSSLGVGPAEVAELVARKAEAFLFDPGAKARLAEAIGGFISGYLAANADKTVAAALGINPETKAKADALLAAKAIELLSLKVRDILATLGIRELVVERIDSLDVEDVEKIVLGFMKEEFKWIDLFGLVLGAIIGLVQAALAAFL